jgi:hypothetical protein
MPWKNVCDEIQELFMFFAVALCRVLTNALQRQVVFPNCFELQGDFQQF